MPDASPTHAPGAYRHGDHAGNRADVWKHAILSSVVFHLCARVSKGAFRYFESHCGGPAHVLPENGEWREGIGRALPKREDTALQGLCYFDQFGADLGPGSCHLGPGSLYPGSWMQVAQMLSRWGLSYELRLCDTSSEVAEQIEPTGLDFTSSDGFAELARHPERYTLMLIDPPYGEDESGDWNRVSVAVRTLSRARASFLVWYPIYSQRTVARVREMVDVGDGHSAEVIWGMLDEVPGGELNGCGMLLSDSVYQALDTGRGWRTLAEKLGGRYRGWRLLERAMPAGGA